MALTKEQKEKLAKLKAEMDQMSPEEQSEFIKIANFDPDEMQKQIDELKERAEESDKKKSDKFFLFRWIEEYGCYLGTAALLIGIYLYLNKDSDSEIVENISLVRDFIEG